MILAAELKPGMSVMLMNRPHMIDRVSIRPSLLVEIDATITDPTSPYNNPQRIYLLEPATQVTTIT